VAAGVSPDSGILRRQHAGSDVRHLDAPLTMARAPGRWSTQPIRPNSVAGTVKVGRRPSNIRFHVEFPLLFGAIVADDVAHNPGRELG
jgi:hypothetical protein